MTPPGLTRRLQQQSRRSGLVVGLSMAATIALVIGGFVGIFVRLQPLVSDFVSEQPPRPAVVATRSAAQGEVGTSGGGAVRVDLNAAVPTRTPAADRASVPTPTPEAFAADIQIRAQSASAVRLRSEPSTTGGDATIVTVLVPGTPLQATGREAPAVDPAADGTTWVEVETEAGQRGWIRRIDLEAYQG